MMISTQANLKFKCLLPNLKKDYIEKSSIKNFNWFSKALDHLKKNKDAQTHTARCPGIINYLNYVWVQKAYQDILIKTNGDGETLMYATAFKQEESKYGKYIGPYVHYHSKEQLDDFLPINKRSLKTIIKIQSPYLVTVPDGYWLLRLPVAYSDDDRFTGVIGIFDRTNFLNVQLLWHELNSEQIIKEGTPLCQFTLVPKNNFDIDITKGNIKDIINTGLFDGR